MEAATGGRGADSGAQRCAPHAITVAAAHRELVGQQALELCDLSLRGGECGATVDKATRTGSTPLMWAASSGHAAVVRQLLALGADRSLVATDGPFRGQTALDVAEARGKAEAAALLRA